MPIAATVGFSGRVAASAAIAATMVGSLLPFGGGPPPATLTGSVARTFAEADSAVSLVVDVEVILAGEPVPSEAFVGPLEIEESIDSQLVTFSFGLAGAEYGVLATTATWTRTPVEVWASAGPPGGVHRRLRAAGYVLTCEEADGPEPVLRVSCGNDTVLYDRIDLCRELAPLSGLHRGEIVADVCTDVGLAVDVPPGAVYEKPLLIDGTKLFDFLRPFGEPEGWFWRFRLSDAVLEAYSAAVKRPPLPPDFVWQFGQGDFMSVRTSPPADVPSRFVVRGESVVFSDELGITTKRTTTRIDGIFAPAVAASKQQTDGSVIASGIAAEAETLRTISVLEDQVQQQAGRAILHLAREWAWLWPRSGRLRTPNAGEPPGPAEGGYYFCEAWIDDGGEYRAWPRQAFQVSAERLETPNYDLIDGTVLAVITSVRSWFARAMGVKSVGSDHLNVVGAVVAGDDQSYRSVETGLTDLHRIDEFGESEWHRVGCVYDDATGAERFAAQESWGYYAPRAAVEANPWWVNYSGKGQAELIAQWKRVQEVLATTYLTQEKLVAGQLKLTQSWFVPKKIDGAYDWGDFKSNALIERYGPTRRELVQYNVINKGAYEKIVTDEAGRHPPELIQGRLPMPRFRSSPWVWVTQQPFELVLDDPTVESWFGFSRAVLSQEYLQNLAEARAWLARLRDRQLAFKHEVVRPLCSARPGDTVLLVDPRHGIAHPCLIAKLRESWTLGSQTRVTGTYSLEQPLR